MNSSELVLTPQEVGDRLRVSREALNITQADAAAAIAVARTTLVAIEQGQRKARTGELQKLAQLYKTSVNAILRRESVHVDLTPRFRKSAATGSEGVEGAIQLLSDLAKAEVELENLLGIARVRNYPPERTILPGDVRAQAEHDAQELRHRLGLGMAPISDIVTLLEMELGVRIFVRRFEGKISGLFAYDEKIGACMLLNANHPRERRAQTAAHETGHFICDRGSPEVLLEDRIERSRVERYADAFGRALFTPARAVMQKFNEVTAGAAKLTRRHVIVLAHFFGVSREAMVRRLEDLQLTKQGTWDWFVNNGGITEEHVRMVLGDRIVPDEQKGEADRPTSLRLNLLAEEVYSRGLMSEGQLARLLRLTRVELREILDRTDNEGVDSSGAISLE